ncbi:MAG: phosphate ABC transporter permease PstA [Candidatus Nitrosotenuis sp.]
MIQIDEKTAKAMKKRKVKEQFFYLVCLSAAAVGILMLFLLLYDVFRDGASRLSIEFLTSAPSRFAEKAGIMPALFGTFWVIGITSVIAIPIGIGAAIYLEEFGRKNRLSAFIQMNIANLAGVPSIVYGLLGLALFVRWMMLDRSVISGALTMSLVILPIVIIASQEALRAVPPSYREASYALGANTWQTIRRAVLPSALPGILTGVILSISRAIGETAPLIMIGALTYIASTPTNLKDPFTALPIQIFNWASRPQEAFHQNAAAGIIVLLVVLLVFNSVAIILRNIQKRKLEQ